MIKELKSLESVTDKTYSELNNFYHKCYGQVPSYEYNTEFEYQSSETRINDVVMDFVRDYALFNVDDSKLLREFDFSKEDDSDLYNCCGPYRLGL